MTNLLLLRRLIHLFSWSGLIDANMLLNDVFKVPSLQTGRMEPLISALSAEEEEMASNMMRRLNTIFSVSSAVPSNLFQGMKSMERIKMTLYCST